MSIYRKAYCSRLQPELHQLLVIPSYLQMGSCDNLHYNYNGGYNCNRFLYFCSYVCVMN